MGDAVIIKGTKSGLLIRLDPERDLEELKGELRRKFAAARGFFSGANFTLVTERALEDEETQELQEICRENGLIPHAEVPVAAGGAVIPFIRSPKKEAPVVAEESVVGGLPGIMLERNFRSGQSFQYAGHVVIMGDVQAGAEIVAEGSIFVMGTLRGVVHAGCQGDEEAVVMALDMNPRQIRIAHHIGYAQEDQRSKRKRKSPEEPEIASIKAGCITVEAYQVN